MLFDGAIRAKYGCQYASHSRTVNLHGRLSGTGHPYIQGGFGDFVNWDSVSLQNKEHSTLQQFQSINCQQDA